MMMACTRRANAGLPAAAMSPPPTPHGPIATEKKTVAVMVRLYCAEHHPGGDGICTDCGALLEYALARLDAVQSAVDLLSALRVDEHNPFNVLVADRTRAVVAQNRSDGMALHELPPGTHLLTNLDLNDATCQRISRSSQRFQKLAGDFAATDDRSGLVSGLHAVLGDHLTAVDDRAPTDQLCIHTDAFGTRSSSILLMDDAGRLDFLHASAAPCRGVYRRIALPWQ